MSDWPVDQITDHRARAVARVVEQYRDADNLKGLIGLGADRTQELESVFYAVLTETDLDTAEGDNLDGIGEIAGEPRLGRSDTEYRDAIKERIGLNRSSGQPEVIIEFIISETGATRVVWQEDYPASVRIYVDEAITESQARRIRRLMPAGVGSLFVLTTDGDAPFGVTGIDEDADPDALGFGELGMHALEFEDGTVLELEDGTALGMIDQNDPILPTEGGKLAELFEV